MFLTYILYIYIYLDIVPDVLDTSGESKNNIGPPSGGPKMKKSVTRRYVMSQSSQKRNVTWLHQMNFVIVGNAWVCHTPIVCFGDDIICKRDIYVSIRERCSWNM